MRWFVDQISLNYCGKATPENSSFKDFEIFRFSQNEYAAGEGTSTMTLLCPLNFLLLFSCISSFILPPNPFLSSAARSVCQERTRLFVKDKWWETQNIEKSIDLDDADAAEALLKNYIESAVESESDQQSFVQEILQHRVKYKKRKRKEMLEEAELALQDSLFTTIDEDFSIATENFEEISNFYGLCLDYLGEFACLRGVTPPIDTRQPIKEFLSAETIAELMEVLNAHDPLTMNLDYVSPTLRQISKEFQDYPLEKLYQICERERIALPYGDNTVVNKNNYERICNFLGILGVEHSPLVGRKKKNKKNDDDENITDVEELNEELYYGQFVDEFADVPPNRRGNDIVFGGDDESMDGDDDGLFTRIGSLKN